MLKNKSSPPLEETLLFFTLLLIGAIYTYFFLFIPQHWTLRDDYALIGQWTAPGTNHWEVMLNYIDAIKHNGRYNIIDAFSRFLHYKYLPVTARSFHLSYFALASVAVTFFGMFLRTFKLSRGQILFALVLFVSNLSFKEMLTTLTVSEGMAVTFFIVSLYCFRTHYLKWLTIPLFVLSFLSKESFVVLCPVYLFLIEDKKRLKNYAVSFLILCAGGAFVLFIHSLPRVYTQPLTLSKITALGLLKSFSLPVLKSFGPFLLLVFLDYSVLKSSKKLLLTGASIIVIHTVLFAAWGPFDSWFYLHLAIPVGWAMILASLWNPEKYPQRNYRGLSILFLCLIYSVLITINGSKNYVDFFSSSTEIADVACRLNGYENNSKNLNFYSNCFEGSSQLMEYLKMAKACKTIPEIHYFGYSSHGPLDLQKSFVFLKSKTCDQVSLPRENLRLTFKTGPWELLEYNPKAN